MIPGLSSDQQGTPSEPPKLVDGVFIPPSQANLISDPSICSTPVILPSTMIPQASHSQPHPFNLINPLQTSVLSPPPLASFTTSSLTPISTPTKNDYNVFANKPYIPQQKRSSMEIEDDLTSKEAPPTKQQLSESKLFKQFGSLQLDNDRVCQDDEFEAENDTDELDDFDLSKDSTSKNARREFDRYVYLLFKDRKSNPNSPFSQQSATSSIVDRLLRDEREKLSKAVILWSPPLKDSFLTVDSGNSDDDDDDFSYQDHKDFLKKPSAQASVDDSITITEVSNQDMPICDMEATPLTDSEDVMLIE